MRRVDTSLKGIIDMTSSCELEVMFSANQCTSNPRPTTRAINAADISGGNLLLIRN